MRHAFVTTLLELAKRDERILLLTGDLGYTVLEPFAEKYSNHSDSRHNRFFNVGVAEQNMVGVGTGLAEAGFIPFLYSIATFAAIRPYEFIRNGPILHQLPVRIVGVGGGFEYGPAGLTHWALEDVALMRAQPAMTIVAPADHLQARTALLETWDLPGPIYYRLGKDDKTTIPGLDGRFSIGRTQFVREGADLLIIVTGSIASEVATAAEALSAKGIECTVMVVASLNPAPIDDLVAVLSRFSIALTVESHYLVGGIGSLVSEVVAEYGISCRVVRCGVGDIPDGVSGGLDHLRHTFGLSSEALVKKAVESITYN